MADLDDLQTQFDDYKNVVTTAFADLEAKVEAAGNDPAKLAALKDDIAQAKVAAQLADPGTGTPTAPPGGTPTTGPTDPAQQ